MNELTVEELQALIQACDDIFAVFGDPDDESKPAEGAPAESAGAWRELRSAYRKLSQQLYLRTRV